MKVKVTIIFILFLVVSVYVLLNSRIPSGHSEPKKKHVPTTMELQHQGLEENKIKFKNMKTNESYEVHEDELQKK